MTVAAGSKPRARGDRLGFLSVARRRHGSCCNSITDPAMDDILRSAPHAPVDPNPAEAPAPQDPEDVLDDRDETEHDAS